MFSSNDTFAASAKSREIELTAMSHLGSVTRSPWPSSEPGGIYTRHVSTSAHILNALAMGPKVPAIKGQAVDANHHRLRKLGHDCANDL
jgi:hypothetical protein